MSQAGKFGTSGGGGGAEIDQITGNAGTAVPAGNNVNILGGNNITTTGVGSTLTIDVTGTVDHSIQIGTATGDLASLALGNTGEGLMGTTGSDPFFTGSPSYSGTVTAATGLTVTSGGASITGNTTINGGSVDIGTDNAANPITIGAGNVARTINIGFSVADHDINIGAATGALSVNIETGSGGASINSIGGISSLTGSVGASVEAASGSINIGNQADSSAINVGTGAAARVITIGNTTTTTSLALKTGTGDFSLASATGTIINALDTGEITYPLQPMFLASQTTDQNDVTGDGTVYTVTFTNEIVDRNSDFDGTSTFTAPVAGMYAFFIHVFLRWDPGNNDCFIRLVTTGATYDLAQESFSSSVISGGFIGWSGSCMAPMAATDTAHVALEVSGSDGLNIDIIGSTNAGFRTPVFSGYLIG